MVDDAAMNSLNAPSTDPSGPEKSEAVHKLPPKSRRPLRAAFVRRLRFMV
jgi:hypothetical protein